MRESRLQKLPTYKCLLRLLLPAIMFGCANHPTSDCRFLPSSPTHSLFQEEQPDITVQLLDDSVVVQSSDHHKCRIETSGFPTDLVWLYPFNKNQLIYIEQSALGTKLNLVDVSKCQILMSRETAAGYRVEDKSVWATCEDGSSCAAESLFQFDDKCEIN
jgi:hypothetical protein